MRKCHGARERDRIRVRFRIIYSVLDWNASDLGECSAESQPLGKLNRDWLKQPDGGRNSFWKRNKSLQSNGLRQRLRICRADAQRNSSSERE